MKIAHSMKIIKKSRPSSTAGPGLRDDEMMAGTDVMLVTGAKYVVTVLVLVLVDPGELERADVAVEDAVEVIVKTEE